MCILVFKLMQDENMQLDLIFDIDILKKKLVF